MYPSLCIFFKFSLSVELIFLIRLLRWLFPRFTGKYAREERQTLSEFELYSINYNCEIVSGKKDINRRNWGSLGWGKSCGPFTSFPNEGRQYWYLVVIGNPLRWYSMPHLSKFSQLGDNDHSRLTLFYYLECIQIYH